MNNSALDKNEEYVNNYNISDFITENDITQFDSKVDKSNTINFINDKELILNNNIKEADFNPNDPIYKSEAEYKIIIAENPEKLFSFMTLERLSKWRNKLFPYIEPKTDSQNLYKIVDNEENNRVIFNDVIRTRVKEECLVSNFKTHLSFLITYFCRVNEMKYKQGLNEVIGVFLLLKFKFNFPFLELLKYVQGFINRYLTNFYYENELYSLKSSLNLLTLLLKYHSPQIHNLFERSMILPEMYGTSIIMTTFSSKGKLNIIYYLWDKIIEEDDPLMIYFLIISLILKYNDEIVTSDFTNIPMIVTRMNIDTITEVDNIFELAVKLRKTTPYSFRILANKLQIFKYKSQELKKMYELYAPDKLLTVPIFPSEILYICYNHLIYCPDDECKFRNKTSSLGVSDSKLSSNDHICEHCNLKYEKEINNILLDLRIFQNVSYEEDTSKTAFLPKMIMVEQKELISDKLESIISERFSQDKGKYHFIFLTSKTDYFVEYENIYYKEKADGDKYPYNITLSTERELNEKRIKKAKLKEKYKIKEYDNLKKLLIHLLKSNFPYISFIYGGFEAVHEEVFKCKFEVDLLNHNYKCELCKAMKKNSTIKAWRKLTNDKKKSTENKVNEKKVYLSGEGKLVDVGRKKSMLITDHLNLNDITIMLQETHYSMTLADLLEYNQCKYYFDQQILIIMKHDEISILKHLKNADDEFEKVGTIIPNQIKALKNEGENTISLFFTNKISAEIQIENSAKIRFYNEKEAKKFYYEINLINENYSKMYKKYK